jgi:hypothetical protein
VRCIDRDADMVDHIGVAVGCHEHEVAGLDRSFQKSTAVPIVACDAAWWIN